MFLITLHVQHIYKRWPYLKQAFEHHNISKYIDEELVNQSEKKNIVISKELIHEDNWETLIEEDITTRLFNIEDEMGNSDHETVAAMLFDSEHHFLGHIYCWVFGSVMEIVGIRASTFSLAHNVHGISRQILYGLAQWAKQIEVPVIHFRSPPMGAMYHIASKLPYFGMTNQAFFVKHLLSELGGSQVRLIDNVQSHRVSPRC